MTSRRPAGQRGLVRGCCAGLVILVSLIGFAAYLADRVIAAPDLGPPPAGPNHGDTQTTIAISLAAALISQLLTQPHGMVTLSEHDLTVLAQAHNPHPDRYRNIAARVRNSEVLVSADDGVGPITTTAVAHLAVGLLAEGSPGGLEVRLTELDAGQLTLPGWLKDRFAGQIDSAIGLNPLFGTAAWQTLRTDIECLLVAGDGIRIGVHRPGTAASPAACEA